MESKVALVKVESHEDDGLVMHCSPAEAQRRIQELQAFVTKNMVANVDYGVIPGTPKPSLWQPGAQKLCELYGITQDFEDIETVQEWERGFFFYRKRCVLKLRRNGLFIGSGIGSCNSREDRYAWRWVYDNQVPAGIDKATLKQKEFQGKGGKPYVKYRLANEDIYSLVNTVEKMACKRSLVHAVIGVTRSAGIFTQDVEDLPEEAYGQVEDTRPWERGPILDAELVSASKAPVAAPDTKPAPAAKESDEALAQRLIKTCADAATAAQLKPVFKDGGAMSKGPHRDAVLAAYTTALERIERNKTAAKPATATAPSTEAEDTGPCGWADGFGALCEREGKRVDGVGFRCAAHERQPGEDG